VVNGDWEIEMNIAKTKKSGFSLIEIIVVIALLAILLAIGMPQMMQGKITAAVRADANELKADLELMKSYAKAGSGPARLEWIAPQNHSPGYSIKDPAGNVRKTKTFDGKVYGDFSGWSGSYLEVRSNGSFANNADLQVKPTGGASKYFTISIVGLTGMIKQEEH
jgi:prepilin-type N-terminal cleavage/methylation domain-containing protein